MLYFSFFYAPNGPGLSPYHLPLLHVTLVDSA